MTYSAIVERQEAEEIKSMADAVNIPGKTLFSSALAELCLEFVDLAHANIAPFTNLNIFLEPNSSASDDAIVSSKNVFREIYALGTLADPSPGNEEKLIKHVRMA